MHGILFTQDQPFSLMGTPTFAIIDGCARGYHFFRSVGVCFDSWDVSEEDLSVKRMRWPSDGRDWQDR